MYVYILFLQGKVVLMISYRHTMGKKSIRVLLVSFSIFFIYLFVLLTGHILLEKQIKLFYWLDMKKVCKYWSFTAFT